MYAPKGSYCRNGTWYLYTPTVLEKKLIGARSQSYIVIFNYNVSVEHNRLQRFFTVEENTLFQNALGYSRWCMYTFTTLTV
jgi:hypothetical protein